MPEYTLFCPPLETSPHIARDFVASVLRAQRLDDELVDAATLCTSELVTNACVHAKGTARRCGCRWSRPAFGSSCTTGTRARR
ncbi:ATP-binding protein [Streptomyces sp. S1D4-11]